MRSNQEFIRIFDEFAELLELKRENPFKYIAYQKASRSIGDLSKSIDEIYRNTGLKGLLEIEGIGRGIAEKIEEYIKTGKIEELTLLRKQFPKFEIEFLKIPGVGPATAKILYENFKDTPISELSSKLSRKGQDIFQPKSLKKILKGIEIYKNLGNRMMLDEAFAQATPLINYLKDFCQAQNPVAVGSLRRSKDTIGDIDIIASSKNPEKTINDFEKYSEFDQILGKGETKLTATLKNGKEVDLEILPQEKYGSLLLHFTGSKEHNVHLRALAQTKKMSLSEHGIKDISTGELFLFKEEKELYEKLGLEYIEPELREDRGEIEAARLHKLPDLITQKDIKGDLHLHSTWSDGISSIAQVANQARKMKYKYIGLTDHVAVLKNNPKFPQNLKARASEIEKANRQYAIKIFNGAEVSIKKDGQLELEDKYLRMFDFIIASIHSTFDQDEDEITKRLISAIENPFVRIIGHPSARKINTRPPIKPNWQTIFKACVKNNVALEISASPNRLDLVDYLVIEAKKVGVKFFINTDAHSSENLEIMKYGLMVARRGWCEKQDIINSFDLNNLNKWLALKK